jgi:hypothetical protein
LPETDSFSRQLLQLFRELSARWKEEAPGAMTITNEGLRQELALPRDVPTRICYFSVPSLYLSSYRDEVFPFAERLGLVPAAGDEMIGDGGTARTLLDLLLTRAELFVADLSSGDARVRTDLRAVRRGPLGPERIVTIAEESPGDSPQTVPDTASNDPSKVIRRSPEVTVASSPPAGVRPWVHELREWLRAMSGQVTYGLPVEARRLLSSERYRAAIIVAMNSAEVALRNTLENAQVGKSWAGAPFDELLEEVNRRNLLIPGELDTLRSGQEVRRAASRREPLDEERARVLADQALNVAARLGMYVPPPAPAAAPGAAGPPGVQTG